MIRKLKKVFTDKYTDEWLVKKKLAVITGHPQSFAALFESYQLPWLITFYWLIKKNTEILSKTRGGETEKE